MVMPWRVFVTVGLAPLEVWTTSQPGRTSAEFWMNLQMHYELRLERRALRDQPERIKPLEPVHERRRRAYP